MPKMLLLKGIVLCEDCPYCFWDDGCNTYQCGKEFGMPHNRGPQGARIPGDVIPVWCPLPEESNA
jgi:hypothetical protein